ncbi:MAG: hypothetical protein ABIJ09_27370 [Pseudomonadota bacterium]
MTQQRRRGLLLALLAGLVGSSCTLLGDGAGWATVDAQVHAAIAPDVAHQSVRADLVTDQGFEIVLDHMFLHVAGVALLAPALAASEGTATFDPASPPPGYTLCHGGHCHRADGALETYAEIEAKLASGEAGSSDELNTLLPASGELEPGQDQQVSARARPVGALRLTGAGVLVDRLAIDARVELEGQQVPVHILLEPENAALVRAQASTEGLPLEIGPDGPGTVHLTLSLVEDGSFFDGIRFSNLAQDQGAIHVDKDHAGNAAVWELCLAKLGVLPTQLQAFAN